MPSQILVVPAPANYSCSLAFPASLLRLPPSTYDSLAGGTLAQLVGYTVAFLLCLSIFATVRSRSIRQATLLIASYALYLSWGVWFSGVLLTSTVVNFLIGRALRRSPSGRILFLGIAFNLALLTTFKYLPEASLHLPFSSLQHLAHLPMPLGISFWTFQAISF